MKKTILFIVSEYPSRKSATSYAAESVINYLKERHNVICLAINGNEVDDVDVYLLNRNKKQLRVKISPRMIGLLDRMQLMLTSPIYPLARPIQTEKLKKKAMEICADKKVDIVISVCLPVESLMVGAYVKQKMPSVKFIPYFIDGYACGILPRYLPSQYALKRKIRFEHFVVEKADLVIRMEASRKFYEQDKDYWKQKSVYLNPAFLHKPARHSGRTDIFEKGYINVLYTGYLFLPDRNPEYIIDALSRVSNVCLIFIGKNEARSVIDRMQNSFQGKIKVFDFMPREQLIGLMNEADVFLNLGVANSNAISGKIFDYLSYGKPIISTFFKEDDATLKYLRDYELACCIDQCNTSNELATELLKEFFETKCGKRINYSEIEKAYYSSSPKAIGDIIEQL
jgi:glycosyltransferase involved in cell wall biosynthesis